MQGLGGVIRLNQTREFPLIIRSDAALYFVKTVASEQSFGGCCPAWCLQIRKLETPKRRYGTPTGH